MSGTVPREQTVADNFFFASSIWCFGRKLIGVILNMVNFPSQIFFPPSEHWKKLNFYYLQNWEEKYPRSIFKDKISLNSGKKVILKRGLQHYKFWQNKYLIFSEAHEFLFFPSLSPSLSLSFLWEPKAETKINILWFSPNGIRIPFPEIILNLIIKLWTSKYLNCRYLGGQHKKCSRQGSL